jgi:dihydrodipicolinate synthase/N-acetylneuraminate lyase
VQKPDVPFQWFKELAQEVNMPLSIFRYSPEYGLSYTIETMVRMADDIEQVCAIKASSYTSADYYRIWNALKGKISVFPTGGDTVDMLGQMMVGADGLEASITIVGQKNWTRFIALSLDGKYTEARNLFMEKLAPISDYIYGVDSLTTRLAAYSSGRTGSTRALVKEALVAMGIFSNARVRPPILEATQEERQEIRGLLRRLQLLPE